MGRLEKRYDQKTKESLIQYFSTMVEEAGGNLHSLPTKVARKLDPILSTGADERDLVFSGLEDTMMTAYAKIRAIAKEKVRLLFTLPLSPPLPSKRRKRLPKSRERRPESWLSLVKKGRG